MPAEWLGGEWDRLPFVPFPHAFSFSGQGMKWKSRPKLTNVTLTVTHPDGRVVTVRAPDVADEPPDSLEYEQLLMNGFLQKCCTALMRDLDARLGKQAKEDFGRWGWALLQILAGTVDPTRWSTKCLEPGFIVQDETSATSLVAAWERILSPWFDGRGTLNVHGILSIARVLKLDRPRNLNALEKSASVLAKPVRKSRKRTGEERRI